MILSTDLMPHAPSNRQHRASCGHGHAPGHAHALAPERFDRAMALGVGLNLAFVIVEAGCGLWADSLALLADAGHNAGDVVGLLLAWGASRLARLAPSARYTWGLRRATIYAAFANATLLLAACGAIAWEAITRLWSPEPVVGTIVVVVAAIGVAINTLTALLFVRGHRDANVRGAFLHMAADAAVSAGVVAAGIAIALTGRVWIDPLVSLAVAAAIVAGTWGLFRESIDLALDAVPRGIETGRITQSLAGLPGVIDVHELHVWGASTSETSLTVHLTVGPEVDRDAVLRAADAMLRRDHLVAHAAIQVEGPAAECQRR